ncbi:hypothetical protein IEQ34_014464 [Dendrobium chrysotoxum]|uniref:Uncharacterized protein n=1 Tax=Dendrobium chrysotoxum TaxID=161865 RepID=A0AAV7GM18_DENCH|nr:hypothetical protein IEQ34_014464 [Dendrobium chrysotoxum]
MKVPARTDRACFPPPGYVMVAMSIVMGLIVFFRDRGVVLSSECLSRMGRLFSDTQGQDLLRILKLPALDALHYEVHYLSRYVDEEYLFKVTLSTQAGSSHAQMLKKFARVPEVVPQKNHSKRPASEEGLQASRKKRADEVLTVVSKGPRASPSKSYIPEDVLNHQCIGCRQAEELGEYKKKYDSKVKEMKMVEDQLEGCRTELANKITSVSSQNERMDRLHIELVEAQATIKQQEKAQQVLEAENERLQSVLSEKEAQQLPSAVIEEFKKSYAFKIIIEDHIQEARSHIYDVEVKALEAECAEDGFIRGFMKGVRTVHRKTGAEIEGLTPSQASGDASSDSGGEELESEL